MNKYYKFSDGWFTYYVNVRTGEKKLLLDEGDIEVPYKEQEDEAYLELSRRFPEAMHLYSHG